MKWLEVTVTELSRRRPIGEELVHVFLKPTACGTYSDAFRVLQIPTNKRCKVLRRSPTAQDPCNRSRYS